MIATAETRAQSAMTQIVIPQIVQRLEAHFGRQKQPELDGPWEMILWENVAYLADDEQREKAFQALKMWIGTEPIRILSAADQALLEVTRHGIMAEQFAAKLRKCAEIVLEDFDGDLTPVLELPLSKAKKALGKFPGIGGPGAEKILLFMKTHPVLALDSNGLRVLLRLGSGEQKKSYSTTYRLVQKAAGSGLGEDYSKLIQAHLQLRHHGKLLCRRSDPLCGECPLVAVCEYYKRAVA
jgi:endonuclease-3